MSKQIWKPSTILAPVPAVMVSCGTMEQSNILTIAWTGIVCSSPVLTYISVRPERYSYNIIKNSGEFVINLTNKDLVAATDTSGVKSGANFDKFKELHLDKVKASKVLCPIIAQSPVSFECKVKEIIKLGSHDMFLAEIVAVQIDESLLCDDRLCLEKANLIAYSHGEYFELGKKLGSFGYTVKKK